MLFDFSGKEFVSVDVETVCLSRVGTNVRGEIADSAGSNSIAVRREVELDSMTISDAALLELEPIAVTGLEGLELDFSGVGPV